MSIGLIGDVHGEWEWLHRILGKFNASDLPPSAPIIQVGDLGLFPDKNSRHSLGKLSRKMYYIDGNHEYFPYYEGLAEVTEIRPNLWYIPRGTVLELDGRRVGFLGGGESIDKDWRTPGFDWFPEESVTTAQAERLMRQSCGTVDLLITHTPPLSVFMKILKENNWMFMPEFSNTTRVIEAVWNELGKPPLICGHMHVEWQGDNVHILDILGTLVV